MNMPRILLPAILLAAALAADSCTPNPNSRAWIDLCLRNDLYRAVSTEFDQARGAHARGDDTTANRLAQHALDRLGLAYLAENDTVLDDTDMPLWGIRIDEHDGHLADAFARRAHVLNERMAMYRGAGRCR